MTALEKDSYDLFLQIRDAWTNRMIARWDFMELVGSVRKMITRFEAMQSGCPTGKHYEPCTCVAAVEGHSKSYQPRRTV